MKLKTLLLPVFFLIVFIPSCIKKEETVAPTTTTDKNYYLVVYRQTTSGGSSINVEIEGKGGIGSITSVNGVSPDCASKANGYVKYALAAGNYNVKASGADGKVWTATANITTIGCFFLVIP